MIDAREITKPTYHHYTYRQALQASERVDWRVEDIIGGQRRLDFDKPFLPEAFSRTRLLPFLSAGERLALSQIRGNDYLCIFGVLEEGRRAQNCTRLRGAISFCPLASCGQARTGSSSGHPPRPR